MQEHSAPVRLDRDGPIVRLVLNRPEVLNALDVASARELLLACETVAASDGVRVVIVCGEGRAFMAGGDINTFHADDPSQAIDDIISAAHGAIAILRRLDVPVLASLHGAVAGFGLSLSLACDLAIAAEGTRFSLSYSKIGTSVDGGASYFLPRIVGLRRAMEISLLAETFDAAEALRLGIVNRVVPAPSLAEETTALARRLADGPTFAYGRIKRLLNGGAELEEQLERERLSFLDCARTGDFAEGVSSFLAKRPPVFHGR